MISAPDILQNCDEATRYNAAKSLLRRSVLTGDVGHGEQLKPELELCRDLNLSRSTVRKAIADLVDEGLLERFRGRGTFVNIRRTAAQQRLLAFLLCRHTTTSGAYDLVLRGADEAATARGYQLMPANSQNDASFALDQAIRLNELRVAGTILAPLTSPSPDRITNAVLKALKGSGQKVVLVDEPASFEGVPSVWSQNQEPVHDLTCHLIRRGYKRIAFLTSSRGGAVAEREDGFRQAMEEHGLEVRPEYLLHVARRDPVLQGIQEVDVFLAMRKPPEAIVCLHDLIALNVLKHCEERGWRVPDDVAVVGFDDLPQAATSKPPLTTVHQPLIEIGRRAVELLIQQLEGAGLHTTRERLPCQLVIRKSCGS